jgi:hypothetical protein
VVKLEPSSFLVSWFYYYYCLITSYCFAFFNCCHMFHGRRILQISQKINSLHAYFFIVSYPDFSLHAPLLLLRLKPLFPSCVDALTLTCSTLHGHSDMVVIMQCRGPHKTCCFSVNCDFYSDFFGERVYQVPAYKNNNEPLATEM